MVTQTLVLNHCYLMFYNRIHTENFVLVDSKKRVRGFYDGTNLDGPTELGIKNVKQLIEDINWLLEEEKNQ